MYNFLRAQFQNIKPHSINKLTRSGAKIVSTLLLLAMLVAPKQTFAAVGFNGAIITTTLNVCGGNQASILFTPTTCTIPGTTDWSATYVIDSSFDGGTSWFTPTGVTTGTVSAASPTFTYLSAVFTTGLPTTVYYRIRLVGLTGDCVGSTGYTSPTITVHAYPQPAPITGPHTVCVGTNITLSDPTAGGTWSVSPLSNASITSGGVLSGIATGTVTAAYTMTGGCASTYAVTVNPAAPTISGPTTLCSGATASYVLSAPATGTWSSSLPTVATVDPTGVVTAGAATGSTTITFTESATTCFSTFVVSVNSVPSPIACNPSPICEGTSITLCDATTGGTWSGGNIAIASISSSGVVTANGLGTTTVTYTVGGCSTTAVVTVNERPAFFSGSPTVCVGGVTTLSSSPGPGTWTGDNPPVATVGSGLGDVHGLSAGIVNVTYTITSGCFRTLPVTVNPLPAAIVGPDSVCAGGTTTLTDPSGGGTWSSSIPAIASIGSATGIVTAGFAGTTTISYTSVTTGCAATMVLTVNPNPIPSNGIGTLCPGETALLSNSTPGTGTWSSSNPLVATIGSSSGAVTAVAGGNTNITFTLSTGCFVVDVETVNPAPAPIMGLPNTCIGFTAHLTDLTPGGTWTSSNTTAATVDASGNVTGLNAGTTVISYTLSTGCATSVVVTVDPIPGPILGPFTVCEGPLNTITLSHPIPGGTWSSSNIIVAPVSLGSGVVTGLHVGTATITYTLASGCSVTAVVTVNPVPPNNTGTLFLCQGTTTSLGNTVGGGTWMSDNTGIATVGSSTGVVTGVGPGVAHITYTLPGGCTAVSNVTVYALPAIIGTPKVCQGSSILLTGVPPGGLWSSLVPVIASVGSLSGIVTGINEGTTTITYSLATTCYTTAVVTVQALNAPITGVNHVCLGLTTTLSNATPGGGTWMSTDTSIATIDTFSGFVTGVHTGVVTIIFTSNVTGCISTLSFTVNPLPPAIVGPTEVCVGASITLTDPAPGGTWSSSGVYATVGSSSGTVTGVLAGVETIVYTLPTGCVTSYQVTVNPLPSPITGPGSVCFGYTITLSSATAGGVWGISPTTVATISPTGNVTGISPGTAIVTYTIFPTGCAATTVITVNPLPGPITGDLNICLHDSTTLHNDTAGGMWTSENNLIAVINPTSGLLGSVTAGTVTITYTLPTGCYTTAVETINPTPQPIDGTLEVCVGGSVTLFNVTTGGSWTSSNPGVATIGSADGIVTGISPGTTFITYKLPSSCPRVAILTVNPNPSVITGPTHICLGNTATFNSLTPGGTWSSSDPSVAIAIITSGVVFSINTGVVTITYTMPTGCYTTKTLNIDPVPTASSILPANAHICVGSSTNFSNPAYPGGTWSISTTTPGIAVVTNPAAGTVQGLAFGTAILSYTLPSGCDTFVVITIDSLPKITGPSVLCAAGGQITLTGSPAGGTWVSSNVAVATVGITTPSTATVTSGLAGNTIITYTAPGTGCKATRIITVNPNPNMIVGFDQVCLGSTSILSTTTPGGTWSSSNTAFVTVTPFPLHPDSVLINGVGVGVATITYTLSTGCIATKTVTVNPLPQPITGPHTVCVGSSITLSNSTVAPLGAWQWLSSDPSKAKVDTVLGVVTGISAGNVIITFRLSTGCYTTYSVTVNPLPPPIYGPGRVCVGGTIALHDTTSSGAPTVGTWSSLNPGRGPISTAGVVTGLSAGLDTIRFTIATGCFVQTVVTIDPIPDVHISGFPTFICKHSSTMVTVTGAGPFGTYTWAPPTGLDCSTCSTVNANPLVTTTYTVTGTTQFGCSDTAMVTVIVDSLLNDVKITGQDTVCRGSCTQLIASGRDGTFFNWSPATGLSCTICDTVKACPDVTTNYVAVAIDSFGCQESLPITITVMPLPRLGVLPNPAIVCRGSATQLHARDSNAVAGYNTRFEWFPNVFISCADCADPFVTDTFNLIYKVTGITPFGCTDSIKVPITVLDSAINTINKDTTICLGNTAQLYATSFNADGARSDFYWLNPYAMSDRYIANPTVTPLVTTTYALLITPNVCFPDTLYTTVKVVPFPIINITPPSATVASGTPVSFTASIGNDEVINNYIWTAPPGAPMISCDTCFNIVVTPTATATYTFTATSVYGCTSSAEATVHIFCESSEVFIPNTFTPNGDGVNDRFYVSGKGISTITKFQVFNRWGEMVFETRNITPNDPSAGWDGQYKGIVLEPDVFIYLIEATCNLGEHFTYKGDISIVR